MTSDVDTMWFSNKAAGQLRPDCDLLRVIRVGRIEDAEACLVQEQEREHPSSTHLSIFEELPSGEMKFVQQICSGDEESTTIVMRQKGLEYGNIAEKNQQLANRAEAEATRVFLRRAGAENARIVSTNDLLDIQIAEARRDGRMLTLQDGLGFVLLPFDISTPKDKAREEKIRMNLPPLPPIMRSSEENPIEDEFLAQLEADETAEIGREIVSDEIRAEIAQDEIREELAADAARETEQETDEPF